MHLNISSVKWQPFFKGWGGGWGGVGVCVCVCNWTCCLTIEMYFQLHQPRLWFITGVYLVKRWFLPAAARARGQSNDLNRDILASNLFNCRKEVINAPPVPSVSRCIHIVYRHKNIWEYQWSNFIYNCMSTFLHYVRCKDALLDCSAPGSERCESLTGVDEILMFGLIFTSFIGTFYRWSQWLWIRYLIIIDAMVWFSLAAITWAEGNQYFICCYEATMNSSASAWSVLWNSGKGGVEWVNWIITVTS